MFYIDGLEFDGKCEIVRTAEMTESSISGPVMDRTYFHDVLGTYLQYELTISPVYDRDLYDRIYEILTQPVESHYFLLPYGQGLIAINGRVSSVSDTHVKMPGGYEYWKATRFTIISNHPSKMMSLSEVLSLGRFPMPNNSEMAVGDTWIYTSDGWVQVYFEDADDNYY